jgi:hypothetical protein
VLKVRFYFVNDVNNADIDDRFPADIEEAANRATLTFINSERQKCGINSLKIKQHFFQKDLWTGQF